MKTTLVVIAMNNKKVNAIELVLFRPKPGKHIEEVINSLEFLNPILQSYQGFIGRQLAQSADDMWMDLGVLGNY